MKVGDKIFSNKVRTDQTATIVKADVYSRLERPGKGIRTKYVAKYDDGLELTFYGFDINRSIFKKEECDGQMCLSEFMTM